MLICSLIFELEQEPYKSSAPRCQILAQAERAKVGEFESAYADARFS